jgi:hypothetical protein
MRPMLEGLYEPGSPIKFIALDPPPSDGFTTNLNVVVRDAAPGDTVEEFGSPVSLKELKRQAAELLRGPVESDLVDLPAGTAHKLSVKLELKGLSRVRRFPSIRSSMNSFPAGSTMPLSIRLILIASPSTRASSLNPLDLSRSASFLSL